MTPIAKRNAEINAILRELLSENVIAQNIVDEISLEYGGNLQWWRCFNIAKNRRMITPKYSWINPEEFGV